MVEVFFFFSFLKRMVSVCHSELPSMVSQPRDQAGINQQPKSSQDTPIHKLEKEERRKGEKDE